MTPTISQEESQKTSSQLSTYAKCVFEHTDIIEIRCIERVSPTVTKVRHRAWYPVSELSNAKKTAELQRLNKSYDCYIGANPRPDYNVAGNENIILARCVFVDFDKGYTIEQATEKRIAVGLPEPTLTIRSGHGVHFYWRLPEPMIDMALWEHCQEYLIGILDSDKTIKNPERIMRLPGLMNIKDKSNPVPCVIVDADASRRYSPDELGLPKQLPVKQSPEPYIINYQGGSYRHDSEKLDVERWLKKHGQTIYDRTETKDGATRWFIACPGVHLHTTANNVRDCCITQEQDGRLGGVCFHSSCGMSNWDTLRDAIGGLEFSDYQSTYSDSLPVVDLSQFGQAEQPAPETQIDNHTPTLSQANEFPLELLQAPGLIKEFVDYCGATAPRFLAEAAFANAISIVSVLTGRKIRSRTGMRTNIYMVLLAPSRSGKDWSRQRTRDCLEKAGMIDLLGAEKFASESGLISQVHANPSILFQIDEVNRYFATISAAGAKSPHLYGIFSTLMELHGQAGTSAWTPKGYGDSKNNKTISYPHCVLFCTGTPDGFWSAIRSSDATDGFLGRMMVVEARVMPRKKFNQWLEPPQNIIDIMQQWGAYRAGDGNLNAINPTADIVPFDPAAAARLQKHNDDIEDRLPHDNEHSQAIWAQASANAEKLAMIFMASRGPKDLLVTEQDADYAIKLSNWCTRLLIERIASHVSENPAEAKRKRVLEFIRKHGEIDRSTLTNKTQFLNDHKERSNILLELIEGGRIEQRTIGTGGRTKQVYRFLG